MMKRLIAAALLLIMVSGAALAQDTGTEGEPVIHKVLYGESLFRIALKYGVTVNELAAPFAMSLPAISKHLKVLERAGLITQGRKAQWRPCRLDGAPLKEASDWLAQYHQFWDESFTQLDAYLETLKEQETEYEDDDEA